jgi:hypothetical protein
MRTMNRLSNTIDTTDVPDQPDNIPDNIDELAKEDAKQPEDVERRNEETRGDKKKAPRVAKSKLKLGAMVFYVSTGNAIGLGAEGERLPAFVSRIYKRDKERGDAQSKVDLAILTHDAVGMPVAPAHDVEYGEYGEPGTWSWDDSDDEGTASNS